MINVLIFPAGTEIGKEIFSALKYNKDIQICLAGSDHDSHARHYESEYHIIPDVSQTGWLNELNILIQKEKIDYIFAAHDEVLLALSEKRELLLATVLCPSKETCNITRYKSLTYRSLSHVIPVPKVFRDSSEITQWPVFVKPDRGQGAQGALRIDTPEALKSLLAEKNDLIICEYLNGDEFTVDCFSDRQQGLQFYQARTRKRIRAGISMTSSLINIPEVEKYARSISESLQLYGAWFFQLKRSAKGVLTLLEVAPRIAGTMALNRVNGINFPLLTIYEAMRMPITLLPICTDLTITRSLSNQYKHDIQFEHVYIDYDDTIVVKNKICLPVIKFLYQCVNNNIQIHLITRHAGNIEKELKKRRIDNIFDTIFHLDRHDKKSNYVKNENAIFIDDSFSERFDVFNVRKIPVFDIDMLDMLIEE